jgi:hypothetical protein
VKPQKIIPEKGKLMKPNPEPRILLCTAGVLLLMGFVLPLLMIMQVLESTLFLNFLAYTSMTLGSMLGFIGITSLVVRRRRRP